MTAHATQMPASYRIRTMAPREVAMAIDWAAAEGWNPGLHDAACFRATDRDGFLVGLLDDVPIATISVVKYGATFGFLGLYIVNPPHRGRGYGLRLWNAGLEHLGARTVGLDGVVAQQANYRGSGFALAYRNVRYQGRCAVSRGAADPRIVPLSSIAFEAVCAYDGAIFPAPRAAFLECWIAGRNAIALGILSDGKLAGYGVIRTAREGFKIGPLFADDAPLARALLESLAAAVPAGSMLYLDVPEANPAAVALAQAYAMNIVFETARMYAGGAPDAPLDKVFGVTTFELG